jgi:membrane-bound lytic murein transglycosylase D
MFKKTILASLFAFAISLLTNCSVFNPDPLAHDDGTLYYTTQGNSNLWLLLGEDLNMNHYSDRPEVATRIKWYMTHKIYLEKVAQRGSPYVYYILQEVKKRHLPSEIALLPIIESGYDPFAYSTAGAAGLWQMMPGTASGMRIRQNWWYDGRRDIYASTNAALNYLQYLHKEFHGDWLLALAAYNSGNGTVMKAIKANRAKGLPTDFWHLQLPAQTQQYVPNLLAIASIVADPSRYPVQWPTTKLAPFVTAVQVGSQIDLAKAATLAGISLEKLYLLNPGFNRWATDPDGQHVLLVPADKAEAFKENLAKLPKNDRVTWQRYTVQPGNTLGGIAKKFATSVRLIKDINNLHDNVIHADQVLLIPKAKLSFARDVLNEIKHYLHHQRDIPGPNRVVHVVQPGDSLWKIANSYHLSINDIRYWNHLKVHQALTPGAELILWTEDKKRHSSVSIRPYILYYTVKLGDNLRDIAKKNHVTVAQIKIANRLKSNTIHVGQKLMIPPASRVLGKTAIKTLNYNVKSGDSLSTIAHRYGLKTSALKAYNHLSTDNLHIGQTLKIPT